MQLASASIEVYEGREGHKTKCSRLVISSEKLINQLIRSKGKEAKDFVNYEIQKNNLKILIAQLEEERASFVVAKEDKSKYLGLLKNISSLVLAFESCDGSDGITIDDESKARILEKESSQRSLAETAKKSKAFAKKVSRESSELSASLTTEKDNIVKAVEEAMGDVTKRMLHMSTSITNEADYRKLKAMVQSFKKSDLLELPDMNLVNVTKKLAEVVTEVRAQCHEYVIAKSGKKLPAFLETWSGPAMGGGRHLAGSVADVRAGVSDSDKSFAIAMRMLSEGVGKGMVRGK